MARPGVDVRGAEPGDVPGLVELCLEARAESTVGSQLCTGDPELLDHQLRSFLDTPGSRVLYGTFDDEPAGLLLARLIGPGPFTDDSSVHVEALYVAAAWRRRGVGHALLESVLHLAEEAGAIYVFALPLPGARGMQRFLARMGFAPAASHRVATVASLQRRLAAEAATLRSKASSRRSRGLEHLIARRRVEDDARRRVTPERPAAHT